MAKSFHIGNKVKFDSEAGWARGTIQKIHTKPFHVSGKDGTLYTKHASKDNPVYEIHSNISDHIAYHFAGAMHKMQEGGWLNNYNSMPVAGTPEQQYIGLNNPNYSQMYFPTEGNNIFRGLDSGDPVQLMDQSGSNTTLVGPNSITSTNGTVYERRGGWLDKYQAGGKHPLVAPNDYNGIYRSYLSQLSQQGNPDSVRAATVLTLSHEYNVPPQDIFTRTDTPIGSKMPIQTIYSLFRDGKPYKELRQPLAGVAASSYVAPVTYPNTSHEVANNMVGIPVHQSGGWLDKY